jgi:hypothetical protein
MNSKLYTKHINSRYVKIQSFSVFRIVCPRLLYYCALNGYYAAFFEARNRVNVDHIAVPVETIRVIPVISS